MRVSALLVLCVLLVSSLSQAQEYRVGSFSGSLSALLTFPYGDYNAHGDNGGGIGFDVGYVIPGMPLMAGLTGGVAFNGTSTEPLLWYDEGPSEYEASVTHGLALSHILLRFQPQYGVFRPYFEGLAGFTHIWTSGGITGEDYQEESWANASYYDAAFSYGAGGGVSVLVHESQLSETKAMHIYIDARVRYLRGNPASYFNGFHAFLNRDGEMKLDQSAMHTTNVDLITGWIGVTVRL